MRESLEDTELEEVFGPPYFLGQTGYRGDRTVKAFQTGLLEAGASERGMRDAN